MEPEKRMSIMPEKSSSLASRKPFEKAKQMSSVLGIIPLEACSDCFCNTNFISFSKYCGKRFLRNVETSLPYYPWPSQTEKK